MPFDLPVSTNSYSVQQVLGRTARTAHKTAHNEIVVSRLVQEMTNRGAIEHTLLLRPSSVNCVATLTEAIAALDGNPTTPLFKGHTRAQLFDLVADAAIAVLTDYEYADFSSDSVLLCEDTAVATGLSARIRSLFLQLRPPAPRSQIVPDLGRVLGKILGGRENPADPRWWLCRTMMHTSSNTSSAWFDTIQNRQVSRPTPVCETKTLRQAYGTCWFFSIMNAIRLSPVMRELLASKNFGVAAASNAVAAEACPLVTPSNFLTHARKYMTVIPPVFATDDVTKTLLRSNTDLLTRRLSTYGRSDTTPKYRVDVGYSPLRAFLSMCIACKIKVQSFVTEPGLQMADNEFVAIKYYSVLHDMDLLVMYVYSFEEVLESLTNQKGTPYVLDHCYIVYGTGPTHAVCGVVNADGPPCARELVANSNFSAPFDVDWTIADIKSYEFERFDNMGKRADSEVYRYAVYARVGLTPSTLDRQLPPVQTFKGRRIPTSLKWMFDVTELDAHFRRFAGHSIARCKESLEVYKTLVRKVGGTQQVKKIRELLDGGDVQSLRRFIDAYANHFDGHS